VNHGEVLRVVGAAAGDRDPVIDLELAEPQWAMQRLQAPRTDLVLLPDEQADQRAAVVHAAESAAL